MLSYYLPFHGKTLEEAVEKYNGKINDKYKFYPRNFNLYWSGNWSDIGSYAI